MKKEYLATNYEGQYGYVTDVENNVSAESNLRCLDYFNKKIYASQKRDSFCEDGHYVFNYVPMLFSKDYWHFKDDLKEGSCVVTIKDVLSKKKLSFDMSLDTLFPNTQYVHGTIKERNKVFGGCAILIDNCLKTKRAIDESGILTLGEVETQMYDSLPKYDSELSFYEATSNYNETFFSPKDFIAYKNGRRQIQTEINEKDKYRYCLFQIDEEWQLPFSACGDEMLEIHTSKFLLVQAFSETWLTENGLPINTPILACSGDSNNDMKKTFFIHRYMNGEEVFGFEQSTALPTLGTHNNYEYDIYFISKKGKELGGGGRFYKVNTKPKWNKKNPRPLCDAIAFPMFSNDFSFTKKRVWQHE